MSNLPTERGPDKLSTEFWDGLDVGTIRPPHVTLGQPMTDASRGKPGNWNYSTGNSVPEILSVKLILVKKGRVLFNGNARARCKSDNFHEPSRYVEQPISHSCITCPAKDWQVNPIKQGIAKELNLRANTDLNKPLCTESLSLLLADSDWLPFWGKFMKTQIKVVSQQLLTRIRYNFFKEPHWGVSFDMRTNLVQGAGSKYYSAVFENFKVLSPEEQDKGKALVQMFSKRAEEILSEEHEAMDVKHDAEAPLEASEEIPF